MASAPHRVLGRRTNVVLAVALGEVDGMPVVVSGGPSLITSAADPEPSTAETPGFFGTELSGINPQGDIVGFQDYATASFVFHGFLLSKGKFTTIDVPGAHGRPGGETGNRHLYGLGRGPANRRRQRARERWDQAVRGR